LSTVFILSCIYSDGYLTVIVNLPHNLPKEYVISYESSSSVSKLTDTQVNTLETPVNLDGDEVRFDRVKIGDKTILPLSPRAPQGVTPKAKFDVVATISSGKNHVVKRLMSRIGLSVKTLHREAIGNLRLHDLPLEREGDWVELTRAQILELWSAAGGSNTLVKLKLAHLKCRYRWALQNPGSAPEQETSRIRIFLEENGFLQGPCFDDFPGLDCLPDESGRAANHLPFF
jgi:hypothetical protein